MNRIISSALVLGAASLTACGGYAVPNQHLADSYGAITSARALGAEGYPQAALHLKLAEEEQGRAKQLVANGDNEQADYMTARAKSDAELAIAMIREAQAQGRASEAQARAAEGGQVGTTTTTSGTVPTNPNGAQYAPPSPDQGQHPTPPSQQNLMPNMPQGAESH